MALRPLLLLDGPGAGQVVQIGPYATSYRMAKPFNPAKVPPSYASLDFIPKFCDMFDGPVSYKLGYLQIFRMPYLDDALVLAGWSEGDYGPRMVGLAQPYLTNDLVTANVEAQRQNDFERRETERARKAVVSGG